MLQQTDGKDKIKVTTTPIYRGLIYQVSVDEGILKGIGAAIQAVKAAVAASNPPQEALAPQPAFNLRLDPEPLPAPLGEFFCPGITHDTPRVRSIIKTRRVSEGEARGPLHIKIYLAQ